MEFSASQKLTKSRITGYPYGTYLFVLAENLTEKKVIIHFFSGTKRREREAYQRHFMVALKVASNCQLFYLSLSLKISKEG